MRRCLLVSLLPWSLAALACSAATEVQVHISGATAIPPLRAPTDVDAIDVVVQVDGNTVWSDSYTELVRGVVDETIAFRPGRRVAGAFAVVATARQGAQVLARGSADTGFRNGAVIEVEIDLARLGSSTDAGVVDAAHADHELADLASDRHTAVDAAGREAVGTDTVASDRAPPDAAGTDQWQPDTAGTDGWRPDAAAADLANIDATPCQIDPDADGDLHLRIECGGDDCDDTRADTHPGALEQCDGLDHDCDDRTWDVAGYPITTTVLHTGISVRSSDLGFGRIVAAPDGTIGAAYLGELGAVLAADGSLLWEGALAENSWDAVSRIATIGDGTFLVAVQAYTPADSWGEYLMVMDRNGPHGRFKFVDSAIVTHTHSHVVPSPFGGSAAIAVYKTGTVWSSALQAVPVTAAPAEAAPPVTLDLLEAGCCSKIRSEALTVSGRVLVIGGDNQGGGGYVGQWLTGPAQVGASADWFTPTGSIPMEIRAAATYPAGGARALIVFGAATFLLVDVSQAGGLPLLDSREYEPDWLHGDSFIISDAAPLPVLGAGLSVVATNGSRAQVLTSAGDLATLRSTGEDLDTGVVALDAAAVGTGRAALLLAHSDGRLTVQIRGGMCTP